MSDKKHKRCPIAKKEIAFCGLKYSLLEWNNDMDANYKTGRLAALKETREMVFNDLSHAINGTVRCAEEHILRKIDAMISKEQQ